MHGDEPDNAQQFPNGGGYGPPVAPERIIEDYQRIRRSDPTRPVIVNMKRYNGFTYLFAVAMRDGTTQATISVADLANGMRVEVLDEARILPSTQGSFTDTFQGYQVHRYRVSLGK